MSLVDADKSSVDRSTPSPNAHDVTVGPGFAFHYPALPNYSANTGVIDYNHTASSLQDAINHISAAGGGTVTVKDGFYTLTSDLTIPSYVTFGGQTEGSVTLNFVGNYGIKIAGSSAYNAGTISVTTGSATVTGTGTLWSGNLTTSPSTS